ncbi:hypothetical protein BGW37DRAFT_464835 [Umbelopsis sp. PMI_123]|nr:hypothetical protein BGW37DRAFT_464835 [Umbelopsis sp. PMI_123]
MKKPWMDFRHDNTSKMSLDADLIGSFHMMTKNELAIKTKKSLQSMKSILQLHRKLSVRSLRSESLQDTSWLSPLPNAKHIRKHPSLTDTSTVDSGYFEGDLSRTTSIYDKGNEKEMVRRNETSAVLNGSHMTSMDGYMLYTEYAASPSNTAMNPNSCGVLVAQTGSDEDVSVNKCLSTIQHSLDPPPSADDILLTMPHLQRYKSKWSCQSPADHRPYSPPIPHPPIDLAAQVRAALGSAISEADLEWEISLKEDYNSNIPTTAYTTAIVPS